MQHLSTLKNVEIEFTCVEPVTKMSERIFEKIEIYLKNSNIKFEIIETTLPNVNDKLPLNHQFDSIFAAQSFHWFGSKESLDVCHKLLKRNGYLGIIGNNRDLTIDYNLELEKIEKSYNFENAPRFESFQWKKLFEGQNQFKLMNEKEFRFDQCGDLEKMKNRFISISYVSKFVSKSDENMELVKNRIEKVFKNHPSLKNLNHYSLPHVQHVSIYQTL
jgi:SAM-dependent methyltransferase